MLIIHADVPITRRKTLHHVVSPDDRLLYSSRNFLACLAYVYGQGYTDALIVGEAEEGEATYQVQIRMPSRAPHLLTTSTTP